ncbi:hypothetical protein EVAR_102796_1 [Eumeta japonica]|uniref:Uncharacterized protein n=1 Tax=Eumeta variegata TaxID=151549 RepID=A0A4C1TKZ9_EUMVA|nr:hypothetical protein EVAR_102796_1 [Eumeta japonica]
MPEKKWKVDDLNVNKELSVCQRDELQVVLPEYFDRFAFENSQLAKYSGFAVEIKMQDIEGLRLQTHHADPDDDRCHKCGDEVHDRRGFTCSPGHEALVDLYDDDDDDDDDDEIPRRASALVAIQSHNQKTVYTAIPDERRTRYAENDSVNRAIRERLFE